MLDDNTSVPTEVPGSACKVHFHEMCTFSKRALLHKDRFFGFYAVSKGVFPHRKTIDTLFHKEYILRR